MKLYHFTALRHLANIHRDGIMRGEVPLAWGDLGKKRTCAPNLTGSANGQMQSWAFGGVLDKTKIRITVEIADKDERLVRYLDLCKKHGTDKKMVKLLDPYGQSKFWWIYFGVISPDMFTAIEGRKDGEYLPFEDLPEVLRRIDEENEKFIFGIGEGGYLASRPKEGVTESWLIDGVAKNDYWNAA